MQEKTVGSHQELFRLLHQQLALQQEQIKQLKAQNTHYRQAYDALQSQLHDLLRHRFGQRSERFVDPCNPQQDLFESSKITLPSTDEAPEQTTIAEHKRGKKKKNTTSYPRVIQVIPVDEAHKRCACGGEKQVIRYETKELYDYQPAVFQIIEQRREVVACPKGCDASIQTAPSPAHVLPKVKATESLLSHLVVSKLHHRQPLYHLEKYGTTGDLRRETMARWLIQLVKPLTPLINLMKDRVMDYDVASIDATTIQVLKEPGRSPSTKSYIYCIRGGPPSTSVTLYEYNYEHHAQFVDQWFEGFRGCVHMDADNVFTKLLADEQVQASYCNAHARRYFEKAKAQAKKQGLSHEALRFYKTLYKIEREAKVQQLSPDERYVLRQQKAMPLMESFKQWLNDHVTHVLPQSPLGKAFQYTMKHWTGLTQFLEDGRLEVDNNLTEQQIKPIVIARKNFMFANSIAGAHAICTHFSLIRTAIAHRLDPYQYYCAVLKQVPLCQSADDYEKLLPWKIQLAN